MAFKQINLNGGLNLQDSELKKGFNEFSDLQNLRHENGSLVKRHATGASTTISSADIDNMEIYVHRKLQAIKIAAGTCSVEFDHSEKRINLSDMSGVDIPGFADTDLRAVFKAGDTIYINYSGTSANEGVYIIESVVDADTLKVNRGFNGDADETISSGTVTIGFSYADYDDTSPTSILSSDDNSFDGRAFLATHTNTNKFISLINPIDYTDKIDLLDFGTGSEDIHIRPSAYTDAVRFACGLEQSPRIFRYVNRHHFNGILKSTYNTHADLLYPRWIIDTSVPVVENNTYVLLDAVADEPGTTSDNNRYINGTLNIVDNQYEYKLVPVYDGNQEGLLNNSVVGLGTAILSATPEKDNKRSVLNKNTQAVKITAEIDMTKLNPRTSGLNVYRSTNGGTYYKIKTIYMGDNDPNQHNLTTLYRRTNRLWWSGSESISGTTLNNKTIMLDGFKHDVNNGNGDNDFESTGYKSLLVSDAFTNSFTGDLTRSEYGNAFSSKFNDISKATDIIIGGDDNCSGGSATGGWYIADDTEAALTDLGTRNNVSDYDGSSGSVIEDYIIKNPVSASHTASQGLDFRYSNTGANTNLAGKKFHISSGNISGSYIISGWAKAEGFNHPESSVHFYVSKSYSEADPNGSGEQIILKSQGIENANFPWTYFQYQIDGFSTETLYGYIYVNTPDDLGTTDKESQNLKIWGLSLRQAETNYDLDENLRGFMGPNVAVGTQLDDLELPPGSLKGSRIINDDVAYPVHIDADRTFISDNYGPFLRTVGEVPGVGASSTNAGFRFGSSNYQFYFGGTDNTNQKMRLDFFDPGLPDGARHPNEASTSTDVKFKYATMLNGRQFVANVKITGDEDTEEYSNFVMYSESGSPDIIPTSNFIQLQDLQGGEIVGIETLMSDIVVFMTKGIFRINIPSADPTNWSLVEAHPNIGCLHDKGIAKAPNGIYFCSQDGIVYLDSGFSANIISNPIKDTYQSQASSNPSLLRLHYETKNNRIRLLYSNASNGSNTLFYLYDISRGVWTNELHTSLILDEMSIDDSNNTILIESASSTKVRVLEDTSSNVDGGSVPINIIMKTGFEQLSSFDQNALLRRISTKVDATTTGADLSVFFNDSGSASYSNGNYLNGMQSTRVFTGNRGKSIQVKIEDNTNQDLTIEKIELEYE